MTNQEKAIEEKNREKELNERRIYEIYPVKEDMGECDNEQLVVEICKVLISKNLSYREANRVLYNADKALRIKAMNKGLS